MGRLVMWIITLSLVLAACDNNSEQSARQQAILVVCSLSLAMRSLMRMVQ